MNTLAQTAVAAQTVILYGRNIPDDQAEAGTIDNQKQFLRQYASLYSLSVVGDFWDEGVSGTIPLDRRPGGRALIEALENRRGAVVLVYRLDRLGRSLKALLQAHDQLDSAGVTIKSATEPFDTSSSIGKFLFQLLGSLAELERSTIVERTSMGRDRVAKLGKWTGGPVPFGYDVGPDGCLVASARLVPTLNRTEAEIARDVFEHIVAGSSCIAEAERLNALGVPAVKRWSSGKTKVQAGRWRADRVTYMVRNSAYMGTHLLKGKNGTIERPVPPLVDRATWEKAQAQLVANQILATKNARRLYILRGIIKCACGRSYIGCGGGRPTDADRRWYRCSTQTSPHRKVVRCNGRSIRADQIESVVWADCREFILNPGKWLIEAQRQLHERQAKAASSVEHVATLQRLLADKETERERVMTLFRRGRVSLEDVERELDGIDHEAAAIRTELAQVRTQQELAESYEAQYAEAAALLLRLHGEVDEIERTNDQARMQQVMNLLVAQITIHTEGEKWKNTATAHIRYTFTKPTDVRIGAVVTDTAMRIPTRSCTGRDCRRSS